MKRALSTLMAIGCLSIWALPQDQYTAPPQNTLSLDERLGSDDGAALAILFGANMRGNLEVCDCNYPRGGLARRVGYVEAFKKKFKETPVIQVEGGFFFYGSEGYPAVELQNEQVALAYSRWPVDVINLGRDDLVYTRRLLAREGLKERTQKFPMINNLVSANAVFGPGAVAPAKYLIREVGGPRIYDGKKKLKIGFVGLAEPNHPGGGVHDATVADMYQSATPVILKARKECDVLVIVAHCELDSALKLAGENMEADVVIATDSGGLYRPRQVGNTMVVSAAPGNIQEGDLRLYLDKNGRVTFKFRATDLDALVPSDPAAAAFVSAARSDRERAR